MHGAMWDVLGIWVHQKGSQMCGGARCVSGWGLSCGVSFQHVVGGPVDVDVDVDAHAVQRVRGVRAHWVCVGGARNMVVGLECVHWECFECAGFGPVQTGSQSVQDQTSPTLTLTQAQPRIM